MQSNPKILVVDDEFDISNSIKRGLEKKGFEVDAFTDPADALSCYAKGRYDILLIDIRMPKMSGFEFVRAVRAIDPGVQFCFSRPSTSSGVSLANSSQTSACLTFCASP